jgi:sugar lactone lactonase YvrE
MTSKNRAGLPRVLAALVLAAAACATPGGDDDGDDGLPNEFCELTGMTAGVTTLTGCSVAGLHNGARGGALFDDPVNVAVGPDGRIYVADFNNSRIRVVDQEGETTTLVEQQGFRRPFGLAFAHNGVLYVETDDNDDEFNFHSTTTGAIWRVGSDGTASMVAENLGRPRGMVILADGGMIVADHMHHTVSRFNASTGQLTTLAGAYDQMGYVDGAGPAARFNQPYDIVDLGDGSVVVSDFANHKLRRIQLATGAVSTFAGGAGAGNADGPAATATFRFPQGLAIADSGAIYVTDTENFLIRRVHEGQVTTVAGNGMGDYMDSEDPRAAGIYGLEGIDITADGVLYVADGDRGTAQFPHHRVRRAMID